MISSKNTSKEIEAISHKYIKDLINCFDLLLPHNNLLKNQISFGDWFFFLTRFKLKYQEVSQRKGRQKEFFKFLENFSEHLWRTSSLCSSMCRISILTNKIISTF